MEAQEFIKLANAIYRRNYSHLPHLREEIISEALLGMCKGLPHYNLDKGSPGQYFWRCGENAILYYLRKNKKHFFGQAEFDISEYTNLFYEEPDLSSNTTYNNYSTKIDDILQKYKKGKKESTINIIKDRLKGIEEQTIANNREITKQRVNKILNDFYDYMRENYKLVNYELIKNKKGEN